MERDVPRLVDVARNARPQGPPDRHLEADDAADAVMASAFQRVGGPQLSSAKIDMSWGVRREPVALDVDPGPVL